MRLKQEGFAREIVDLEETVEWKDKKIGVWPGSPALLHFLSSTLTGVKLDLTLLTLSSTLFTLLYTVHCKSDQALERQKEYTDAIRTERDELREEVVKLKDILKVLGSVAALFRFYGKSPKFATLHNFPQCFIAHLFSDAFWSYAIQI